MIFSTSLKQKRAESNVNVLDEVFIMIISFQVIH